MNRILLSDVVARIAGQLGVAVASTSASRYVSDGFDPNYIKQFTKLFPAVWVVSQRMRRKDDGRGMTTNQRQSGIVEIMLAVVVQRVPSDPAADLVETRLDALAGEVDDALFAWQPPNARVPLVWVSALDGGSTETVAWQTAIYATEIVNSKRVS